ncbi:hypothetical protein [uncultured Kordia sp.]|uniref:hypothetical protein n=1 Tax=uncultured Kordia sp. TaxID=507699 RepID=UPI002633B488|nr:hypothetical protein [uncultured Kordia sp.]
MSSKHVKAFYSEGRYSLENDSFDLFTEIPNVQLFCDKGKAYSLGQDSYFDISSNQIPCLLNVFKHGHPSHRLKLNQENLTWVSDTEKLSSVFEDLDFPIEKILVITVHDEDFHISHTETYKIFIKKNVTYDFQNKKYNFLINDLEYYLNKNISLPANEEPRTVSGGTIDPIF